MAAFRRHQLLFAVAVSLFGTTLCGQPFPVCDTKCCTVVPSCSAALRVTCNCTDRDSMTLRRGDMPQSVTAIHIWNAKNVVIHEGAVNDLKRLTNFSLRGIDRVEIRGNGMAFDRPSKIRSVKFEDIRVLHLKSNAFSGVWETRTSISISRTTELHVESHAFGHRSTTLGPSLAVRRVGMLDLDTRGFVAPLYYLALDGVNMNTCYGQSFGGKIKRIELKNVTIDEAEARCFSDLSFLSTFSIQSSKINTVHPQAFLGSIRELNIKNSSFSSIQERGLDIRTRSMKIYQSLIRNLSANGLSVTAKSLQLENIRVESLSKNALTGLKMQRDMDGYTNYLVISKLDIQKAEEDSLVFADCVELRMSDLILQAPWPRVCPTEQWARQLTGAAPSGQLTPAQFEVFLQLFDRRLCPEDTRRKFPISRKSPHCDSPPSSTGERYVEDGEYYDYGDSVDDRDVASQGGRGKDEKADISHRDAAAASRIGFVSSATDEGTANTVSSPSNAAEPAAPSVPDPTELPGEAGGSRHVENVSNDHGEKMGTSYSGDIGTDSSAGSETKVAADAAPDAASIHPAETPTDAIRQPAAEAEGGGAAAVRFSEQHRMMLYLSLGAVLSLAAVLAVALLVLLLVRRRRDQKPAGGQRSANELLVAAVEPSLYADCGRVRLHTVSIYSDRTSVDDHQYEQMRKPLAPLPPPPLDQDTLYEGSCAGSQLYESLLDR